jgi:phospholipid transport system substrate-binding protein
MKKLLIALLFASTLALFATPATAATTQEAGNYIAQVGVQTVNILASKTSRTQKQAALSQIFATNVDFPWVARFVMGRYWREATDAQKTAYVQQYQRFLVRHYAVLFSDYNGGKFNVIYSRDEGDDEFSVGMQVSAEGEKNEPVLIDYKIRLTQGSFKIFDVVIEGVSMLTTQRQEFSSIIGSNSIDYLIDMLKKKADSPAPAKQ